jgi:hypothetical protein
MCGQGHVTVQAAAKANDSRIIVRSIGMCDFTTGPEVCRSGTVFGRRNMLSGRPINMCAAAQAKHVPRQPIASRPNELSGQPTVLAKPAIRVMPVIAFRALSP